MSDRSDDDGRSRRRRPSRRRRRESAVGIWVWLAGLALIVVGGVVAVMVTRKGGRDGGGATAGIDDVARGILSGRASPPSGWKEYVYADAGFRAYYPKEPTRSHVWIVGATDVSGEPIVYATLFSENGLSSETGLHLYTAVAGSRLGPHESPSVAREAVYKRVEDAGRNPGLGRRTLASRSVTWMGYPAREVRFGTSGDPKALDSLAVLRIVVTDTYEFHATISSGDGLKLTPRLIDGFFDNIQPLK